MLSILAKKWVLATIVPLIICLSPFPLNAAHKPHHIKLLAEKSYAFNAFYKLHTTSSPSDLIVEVIHEYNTKSSTCSDSMWLPRMRFLELRFTLNGIQNRVKIWRVNDGKYKISGLATSAFSVWHPAIKKLSENLAILCCGTQKAQKKLKTRHDRKQTLASIYVKPLSNRKLRTFNVLFVHSSSNPRKPVKVDVDVQLETYQGKKVVVAVATFHTEEQVVAKGNYSTIKFVHTKQGLKELSKEHLKRSSVWYSWAKKISQLSINRYFKFKQTHNHSIKLPEVKKNKSKYIYIEEA